MPNYKPGDVLLLKFPFTGTGETKRRPALLLLDVGDDDLVVARITSQMARSDFDVEIKQWREAGLRLPSIIRLHKLATLEKQLIERKLGKLSASDWAEAQRKIGELWTSLRPEVKKEKSK